MRYNNSKESKQERQKKALARKMVNFRKATKWRPKTPFQRTGTAIFIFLFAVIGSYLLFHSFAATPPKHKPWQNDSVTVAEITTAQVKTLARSVKDKSSRSSIIAKSLAEISAQRQAALTMLVKTNPSKVNDLLLTTEDVTTLESIHGSKLEKPVKLTGTYYLKNISSEESDEEVASLITKNGEYELYTNGYFPLIPTESTITITGYIFGNKIFVSAPITKAKTPVIINKKSIKRVEANSQPLALGNNRTKTSNSVLAASTTVNVAVIAINFSNTTNNFDINAIKNAFQGSPGNDVNSYWQEASYGNETLSPTFFNPYTLSVSTATSNSCHSGSTDWTSFYSQYGSTINFSSFQRVVFLKNCSGQEFAVNFVIPSLPSGGLLGADLTSPQPTTISRQSILHELAHLAGIGSTHSGFYNCQVNAFIPPINLSNLGDNCITSAYGNNFDILGGAESGSSHLPHPDALHKNNAGWFSPSNFPTVTAAGTTTYTLLPYETSSSGILALNIPRGNSGTAFTVEYRQPIGFDSWITAPSCGTVCNADKGPLINFVYSDNNGSNDNELIDTTPLSNISNSLQDDETDGALLPTKTFTDPEHGISISTISANSSGAVVQVTIPASACARANPTISLTSSNTQTVAPAQPASYTFQIKNNDTAGCPDQTFRLPANTTTGFSAGKTDNFSHIFSPDYFSLAPGATTNVTMTLRSDNLISDGTYNFSSNAFYVQTNTVGSSLVNFPAIFYVSSSAADTTAPSVPTSVVANPLGSKGVNVSWASSTDNVGGSGMAGYKVLIDGVLPYTTSNTSYSLFTDLSPGNHTVTVQSFDHKANISAASTTVNFTNPTSTDTQAPVSPGNVKAIPGDRSVTVSWGVSHDNMGVIGYYISGIGGGIYVPVSTNSVTISNLSTQTYYAGFSGVIVRAVDGNGNFSDFMNGPYSNTANFTTAVAGTSPPTQPQAAYSPQGTATSIKLAWQASSDDKGVAGYYIFRDGRRWATVTSTNYTDTAIGASGSYKYQVEAFDADGNVSPPRNFEYIDTAGGNVNDNSPPTGVSLTSPVSGISITGTLNLSATAQDNTGLNAVYYYLDGNIIGGASSAPFNFSWDSSQTHDGLHIIQAVAKDNFSNYTSSAPVTVNFSNGGIVPVAGDATGDGRVALIDLSILLANYDKSGGVSQGDFDYSGKVGLIDLSILLSNYGR